MKFAKYLLYMIISVTLLSCTMEKRLHRKGFHIQWSSIYPKLKTKADNEKEIKSSLIIHFPKTESSLKATFTKKKKSSKFKVEQSIKTDNVKSSIDQTSLFKAKITNYKSLNNNVTKLITNSEPKLKQLIYKNESIVNTKTNNKSWLKYIFTASSYLDPFFTIAVILILALSIYLSIFAPIFFGVFMPVTFIIYLIMSYAITNITATGIFIVLLFSIPWAKIENSSPTKEEYLILATTWFLVLAIITLISILLSIITPIASFSFLISTLGYALYIGTLGLIAFLYYVNGF